MREINLSFVRFAFAASHGCRLSSCGMFLASAAAVVMLATAWHPVLGAELELFIMAGQSNMVGGAQVELIADGHPTFNDQILYSHNTETATELSVPLQPREKNGTRRFFGPEIGFGQHLTDAGHANVAIIKYARGGTSLGSSWAPDSTLRNDFYNFVDTALADFVSLGHTYTLQGFVWVQGSGDANILSRAEEYDENLNQFVGEVEARYGQATTIINRYHIDSDRPYVTELRTSQMEFGASSPDHYVIHTDDLTLNSDNIHFNTSMHLEVGHRLAQRYIESQLAPGDYNADGSVDAADYTVWRDSLGSLGELSADGNGDGMANQADYQIWRQAYRAQLSSGSNTPETFASALPEPTSLACFAAIYSISWVVTRLRPLREMNCLS